MCDRRATEICGHYGRLLELVLYGLQPEAFVAAELLPRTTWPVTLCQT